MAFDQPGSVFRVTARVTRAACCGAGQ